MYMVTVSMRKRKEIYYHKYLTFVQLPEHLLESLVQLMTGQHWLHLLTPKLFVYPGCHHKELTKGQTV